LLAEADENRKSAGKYLSVITYYFTTCSVYVLVQDGSTASLYSWLS